MVCLGEGEKEGEGKEGSEEDGGEGGRVEKGEREVEGEGEVKEGSEEDGGEGVVKGGEGEGLEEGELQETPPVS